MNLETQEQCQVFAELAMAGRIQEDGGCLIWTGRNSGSSKHPKFNDQVMRRVVWQARNGMLKPGQLVTVTCGCRLCLEHLAVTTKSEVSRAMNADPRVKAIKRAKSTAIKRATAPKLDMDKARAIRASDDNNHVEAAKWGVTHGMVSKIRTNKAWVESHTSPFTGLGARSADAVKEVKAHAPVRGMRHQAEDGPEVAPIRAVLHLVRSPFGSVPAGVEGVEAEAGAGGSCSGGDERLDSLGPQPGGHAEFDFWADSFAAGRIGVFEGIRAPEKGETPLSASEARYLIPTFEVRA